MEPQKGKRMNTLDKQTKVMLDTGSAVMLDGKYLIISPETFRTMLDKAVPAQTAEEKANRDFIQHGCKCHFCDKESCWGTEYIVTIEGGYNSDHDMETVSMDVCAECLERMLAAVN